MSVIERNDLLIDAAELRRLSVAIPIVAAGLLLTSVGLALAIPSMVPAALLLGVLAALVSVLHHSQAFAVAALGLVWIASVLAAMLAPMAPEPQLSAAVGAALALVLATIWWLRRRALLRLSQARAMSQAHEQRLREERDFAVTLMTTMSQGLSVTDADGRYVYVNPAFARMTGYAPEQMIGRSVSDITPDDERDRLRRVQGARKVGESSSYEMRMRCADGHEIYALISGSPRFRDGQYVGNVAVITDLTERRQMEQAFKDERDFAVSVMNTVGQGLLVANAAGVYEFVNPAMMSWLGYERDQMVGKSAHDFSFPEDADKLNSILETRRRGIGGSYELRLRRSDGTAVYGLVTGAALMREGKFAGSIVAIADLTERKRAEAALAFARDEAVTASRLKSEFLANMSHELRTPLNVVLGACELMQLTDLSESQRRYVDMIERSGKGLATLLGDILDLSKIEAGRLEIISAPFDVRACVGATMDMVEPLALKRGLALHVAVDDTLPQRLVGDEARLRQVLLNLLSNAVKFTQAGTVSLDVGHHAEGGAHRLRFTVRDTGIGIPSERLADIFEPFVQVDSSMTRRFEGTGLGLAICRRLVDLMGGSIQVESVLGQGSTFSFSCQCRLADAAPS